MQHYLEHTIATDINRLLFVIDSFKNMTLLQDFQTLMQNCCCYE